MAECLLLAGGAWLLASLGRPPATSLTRRQSGVLGQDLLALFALVRLLGVFPA